jgi:hypothetical protein
MGIELDPVLMNLDYIHKQTNLICNLNAPYINYKKPKKFVITAKADGQDLRLACDLSLTGKAQFQVVFSRQRKT